MSLLAHETQLGFVKQSSNSFTSRSCQASLPVITCSSLSLEHDSSSCWHRQLSRLYPDTRAIPKCALESVRTCHAHLHLVRYPPPWEHLTSVQLHLLSPRPSFPSLLMFPINKHTPQVPVTSTGGSWGPRHRELNEVRPSLPQRWTDGPLLTWASGKRTLTETPPVNTALELRVCI